MRKLRVYVDSSVIGGAFNTRIAEATKPFWDTFFRDEIVLIASDVLEDELQKAPQRAQDFYADLPPSQIEKVVSTDETDILAERYIVDGVVSKESLDDCKLVSS